MIPTGGIVWLASFPKSGNTWFRILLANLMSGKSEPADINNLDELNDGIASSRNEFESMTMIDSDLISHDDIDGLRPRVYEAISREATELCWMKAHDAYTLTSKGEPLLGKGVARAAVYLVRDPREVSLSLAFHNNTTVDEAIKLINGTDSTLGVRGNYGLASQLRQKLLGWSQHVLSWTEQADVPVHILRYEDLAGEPTKSFGAALEFVNVPATPDDIERAVRHADFAELRRQEDEKGFAERFSRTAPFFRSGRVDSWRELLTIDQIGAIEECHHDLMEKLGYEV
jgi:aryl sulfotransferase